MPEVPEDPDEPVVPEVPEDPEEPAPLLILTVALPPPASETLTPVPVKFIIPVALTIGVPDSCVTRLALVIPERSIVVFKTSAPLLL